MRTSRFTDEQIIGIVKEYEAGAKLAELCRRHGVSSATFYKPESTDDAVLAILVVATDAKAAMLVISIEPWPHG